jgi:carbonic anhydrase
MLCLFPPLWITPVAVVPLAHPFLPRIIGLFLLFCRPERKCMTVKLHKICSGDDPALVHLRSFFRHDAVHQDGDLFGQEEGDLPGEYGPPRGRLILATKDDLPAGCVGIRPLSDGMCAMQRLYVAPQARRQGVGRRLACAAILAAKEAGYRRILLDIPSYLRTAIKFCRELGFQESPTHYPFPVEGRIFLVLELERWSEEGVRNENLSHLFDFNRAWSRQMQSIDPRYFEKLSHLKNPQYLWIGCSDSRVPANQIVGLLPGEVFVHRNVANVVVHTDLNCLSVIQFAVDVLQVRHIMVVGHYDCNGVKAALTGERAGLVDIWLRHVQDVHQKHRTSMERLPLEARHNRLCELNALEQAVNVCQSHAVQDAWRRGQPLTVHSWIYGLQDGLVHDLGMTVHGPEALLPSYTAALAALA